MPKPRRCCCNRLPSSGEKYSVRYCRFCYLYHTDDTYNRHWGGPGLVPVDRPLVNCPDDDPLRLISPLGTSDLPSAAWEGRLKRKPWKYKVSAVIPHLNTIEPLKACIALLRLQTERPYIMVIDTGSPPEVCEQLEKELRSDDLEIHYIKAHGYWHTSQPVTVAQDLAMTLCRSDYLYCTHSDVFLRRRDYLEWLLKKCNHYQPVVGYQMSNRSWATKDWVGMASHTATMLYMPEIRRLGATWNLEHAYKLANWEGKPTAGWPDTETGFNYCLRNRSMRPLLIGKEYNYRPNKDRNLVHVRSYPGSKAFSEFNSYYVKARKWMYKELIKVRKRIDYWKSSDRLARITFSIFLPTVGRESLGKSLHSIAHQNLQQGDEVIIVHDGPQNGLDCQSLLTEYNLPGKVLYLSDGPHKDWGHTPRNLSQHLATATHCLYLDDDDYFLPQALYKIRRAIDQSVGANQPQSLERVHLFRGNFPKGVLWHKPVLKDGNVGTPLICHPNKPTLFGKWKSNQYNGDYYFIRDTVERSGQEPIWHEDVIVKVPLINGLA